MTCGDATSDLEPAIEAAWGGFAAAIDTKGCSQGGGIYLA
jgi:hypothetical protein